MNTLTFGPSSSTILPTTRESRREASRREVMLPCQAVRERDFTLIADRTLDISPSGLLLPLRKHVLTGESLIVSFSIPGMWIDAEATVARVIHGRRPGDDGLAVGVLFDRIAPSARAALAAYLHGRRHPLPRRGPLARVRRGDAEPKLADEDVMRNIALPNVDDVTDITGEATLLEEPEREERVVDGLGVLRAVVGAWQSLIVDNDVVTRETSPYQA